MFLNTSYFISLNPFNEFVRKSRKLYASKVNVWEKEYCPERKTISIENAVEIFKLVKRRKFKNNLIEERLQTGCKLYANFSVQYHVFIVKFIQQFKVISNASLLLFFFLTIACRRIR